MGKTERIWNCAGRKDDQAGPLWNLKFHTDKYKKVPTNSLERILMPFVCGRLTKEEEGTHVAGTYLNSSGVRYRVQHSRLMAHRILREEPARRPEQRCIP